MDVSIPRSAESKVPSEERRKAACGCLVLLILIVCVVGFVNYGNSSFEEIARMKKERLVKDAAKEAAKVAQYLKPVMDELQWISGNLTELRAAVDRLGQVQGRRRM
jgi:Tfp pilus assembly protein PilO